MGSGYRKNYSQLFLQSRLQERSGKRQRHRQRRRSVPGNWEVVSREGDVSFEDFVNLDESVAICGELTDQEILAEVATRKKTDNPTEEEERPEVTDKPIPTSSEALDRLHELRRYVQGQANISDSPLQALNMLHDFALLQRIDSTRKLKISIFFFFFKCE